ncbi:cytotoxin [Priestia sp. JV24]|uniref:cytotoxin n=1 Tax=Priestia sp. JV24 TaxID=2981605 RepID=UPI00221F48E4|nr:cytotoxin [Priestia sp. JV24]MCW1049198.1 cytotoxin [Priestia sp. JV24]
MTFDFTNRFKRSRKKIDPQSRKLIDNALVKFEEDYSHPSLNMKKMEGYKNPDVWEIRASKELRLTFEWIKPDTFKFRNCGHHDETLKNP